LTKIRNASNRPTPEAERCTPSYRRDACSRTAHPIISSLICEPVEAGENHKPMKRPDDLDVPSPEQIVTVDDGGRDNFRATSVQSPSQE
jgi:hypothetical protein